MKIKTKPNQERNIMKTKETLVALAFLFVATGLMSVRAAESATPAPAPAPSADAILRQMSDKLGAAQKFSFKARRDIGAGLVTEDGLPNKAEVTVTVQRPDKVVIHATSTEITRHFYDDGKKLTLFDKSKNLYSTVPIAVSLDELPAELAEIYGFTPPVAGFLVSNPYEGIAWRAQTITYAGTGSIKTALKSVPCHRIALSGTLADAELWIGVNDLLPHRLTATVKRDSGNAHVTIEFSDWNLAAKTKDADFVFSPPKGATQITMLPLAETEAAAKPGK